MSLIPALAAAGCGSSGVSAGATVSVYLSAPMHGPEGDRGRELCSGAKRGLAMANGKAGDLHIRLRCLDASGPSGNWTLARVGANARQAAQDSTTVAYITEPNPQARLQSRPIVEQAGIAEVVAGSGAAGMNRVLHAIEQANPSSLRESVAKSLPAS